MANTPTAQSPASQDSTSPAKPLHRIEVDGVCISYFPNDRATIQRRYRDKDGKTAYAHSLRPSDFATVRKLLEQLEEWHASNVASQAKDGA